MATACGALVIPLNIECSLLVIKYFCYYKSKVISKCFGADWDVGWLVVLGLTAL